MSPISRRNKPNSKKNTTLKGGNKVDKLKDKLHKCLDKINKLKKGKDLMSLNPSEGLKLMKLHEECNKIQNSIDNLDKTKRLNEEQIMLILDPYDDLEKAEKEELVEKMKTMTFDKKYKSCFSGKKSENLFSQVKDKAECYLKYGTW
jgi:hypothetical protein